MAKKKINLFSLKEYLRGREWDELTKEEKQEISQKIVDMIKKK
jgi:hypothetical protein